MWRPVGRSVTESEGPNSGPDLSGPFKIYYGTIILSQLSGYLSYISRILLYLIGVHADSEHRRRYKKFCDPGFCFRSRFVVW